MLFEEKWRSLNSLNSKSNLNFADTHVILGKSKSLNFFEFELVFEFCSQPCYLGKKAKSLNFHDSNSNLNFAGTHVILEKKEKNKFFQFEFEF